MRKHLYGFKNKENQTYTSKWVRGGSLFFGEGLEKPKGCDELQVPHFAGETNWGVTKGDNLVIF